MYTASGDSVQISVDLPSDEATRVALLTDEQARRNGIQPAKVWMPNLDNVEGELAFTKAGGLVLKAERNGDFEICLS